MAVDGVEAVKALILLSSGNLIMPLQLSEPQFTQMLSGNGSMASGPPFQARKIAPHPKQGEGHG